MSAKIATLPLAPRKRAANRVRRLRGALSREAFVELLRERGVDVSARTLGDIERGRVRMTALEIVEVAEALVTLRGASKGVGHAASWENPRAGEYPVSHETNAAGENENAQSLSGPCSEEAGRTKRAA